MMYRTNSRLRLGLLAAAVLLAATPLGVAAPVPPSDQSQTDTAAPGKPSQTVPEANGSSSEPLSKKLDRSGGVIHPPSGVDPKLTQPPPAISGSSTPVIPPPGTAGGREDVKPK